MDKFKWITSVLIIGIVLNLFFLDWQFLRLKGERPPKTLEKVGQNREKQPFPTPTLTLLPIDCPSSCLAEIYRLEKAIARITPKVVKEVQKTETVVSNKSSVKEFFVPFGSGKTTARDWEDISGLNAYIDANNYKNIRSVKFEASLRIPTANGVVYARLYNKTDKHPVWGSEVSSEGPTATLKQSGNITLSSGDKLYQVQMKTTMGFESILDFARVKIVVD